MRTLCRLGVLGVLHLGCSEPRSAPRPAVLEPADAAVDVRAEPAPSSELPPPPPPTEEVTTTPEAAPTAPDANLRYGQITVNGPRKPAAIERVLQTAENRLLAWYRYASLSDPTTAGRIGVRFVLESDGTVHQASDGGSDLPNLRAIRCVVGVVAALQFPASPGGSSVVIAPFVYDPR